LRNDHVRGTSAFTLALAVAEEFRGALPISNSQRGQAAPQEMPDAVAASAVESQAVNAVCQTMLIPRSAQVASNVDSGPAKYRSRRRRCLASRQIGPS
jgi:hypothetical protein